MDIFKTLILDTPDSLDNISGVLPVVNGGTGADNAPDARVNLLPDYTGNANKVLSLNGGATDVEWTSNGAGDVAGPASSTDNAVARFDSTTGKVIQNSGVTISDANLLTADALSINNNTTLGSSNSDTVTCNARIASEFTPATDNTYDLGRTGHEWRDLYLDGTANIDSLVADTADINGGTIDGTTVGATTPSTGAFTTLSATGVLTITKATGGQTVANTSGNTTGTYQSFGTSAGTKGYIGLGDQLVSGGSVNDVGIDGFAGNIIFATASATRATVSSTGLAVTGALSATTTLQAKTGTTNPASSGALTGLSMGFDSNAEVSWIQSERNSLAETRSLQLNPNGGNVGIGEVSPQGALQITRTTDHANFVLRSDLGAGGGYGGFIRGRSEAFQGGQLDLGTLEANVGTVRMSINHLGNVGVGTANPGAKLHVQTATDGGIVVNDGTVNGLIYVSSTLTKSFAIGTNTNHPMIFGTNSSFPQMMLATSGDVLIGGTALPTGSTSMMAWDNTNKWIRISKATAAYTGHVTFYNSNGAVGNITTDGSATAYNTSSDYRLKENVVPMQDALQRISKLKPSRFNFISDDKKIVDGFIAHEVQEVVPEAISGEKDAMRDEDYEVTPAVLDDDGNEVTPAVMGTRSVPEYQGIDQSKLVPLLVGALQELTARLEALENN
jgi:hypothetical protein